MVRFFPVAGNDAANMNDFSAPRGDGRRSHAGNDIMGAEGTPLIAVDDGQVRFGSDPLGGNVANLYADDGTKYYYAHLLNFAGTGPRRAQAGEVIGYLGRTGNAATTPPHLHFEVHPGGGAPVDPAPIINSAPRVPTGGGGGGGGAITRASSNPLRILALAALAGATVYAVMNPRATERSIRRLVPR